MAQQHNYYGPTDVKVFLDDESNNLIDISEIVISIGDLGRDIKIVDEAQGFGESWVRALAVGVRQVKEVPVEVWMTTPHPSGATGSISALGTRRLLRGVADTPRTPTRTLRIEYGEPRPAPTARTAAINNAAGYAAGATVLMVDTLSAGTSADMVGEFYDIEGEAYEVTAEAGGAITLNRPLLRAVMDNEVITRITAFFGEVECILRESTPAIDRSTASMIKTALRPTGIMMEN